MMTLISIVAIMVFSLLFTGVFVFGLGTKGPWGSGWTFFIIIALTLSTVTLWVPPAGPVWFGAAWIDLLITGLLISFILSAVTPSKGELRSSSYKSDMLSSDENFDGHDSGVSYQKQSPDQKTVVAAGGFFWMLLLLLCVLIIIGAA